MITINDIDIFVLSYNREVYLLEMLESLMSQSIGSFEIKILDNGSADNTQISIANLNNENIIFLGSEKNNGALWNFERAQNLASKKYTILFHDDDLIHPKYLEYVVKALNEQKDLSIVCSGMRATTKPNSNNWKKYHYQPIVFDKLSKFTSLIYLGFPLNFATVVYKTEYLKNAKIDFEQFGKIADRPLVFDCVQDGKIALFAGQYIQYRMHESQDSKNSKSGPFYNETIALHTKYKSLIFKDDFFIPKIFFLANFYKYIVEEYDRFFDIPYSKKEYIDLVVDATKINKNELFLSQFFYKTKIESLYKLYRFFKRKFGQYS